MQILPKDVCSQISRWGMAVVACLRHHGLGGALWSLVGFVLWLVPGSATTIAQGADDLPPDYYHDFRGRPLPALWTPVPPEAEALVDHLEHGHLRGGIVVGKEPVEERPAHPFLVLAEEGPLSRGAEAFQDDGTGLAVPMVLLAEDVVAGEPVTVHLALQR